MNNPPAFPTNDTPQVKEGMMLRDIFAAAVVPAIYTLCMSQPDKASALNAEYQANCAYILADAMLKAREQ